MTSLRVLHLSKYDNPSRGGVEKVVHELCVGLAEDGIRCDVLAMSDTAETPAALPYPVFSCRIDYKLGAAPLSLAYVATYRRIRNDYDIIHLHHPNPLAALMVCLFAPRGKLVVHWHSDIVKQRYMYLLFKPLETWMLRRAHRIIATSPNYAKNSAPLAPHPQKIRIVPIGIDDCLNEPQPDAALLETLRQRYAGKKIIFSLGRMVYYKGFADLIDAAQHLGDDALILIGGEGPLKASLQQRIEAAGLSSKVKLLGFLTRAECLAYFRLCHAFCLSSVAKSEAFGVVQLEAMCFSKPLISTRIPGSGVDWVNLDGVSGLTVDIHAPQALAGAIRLLCNDEALYAKLSAGARARYETLFTRRAMNAAALELYQTL